MKNSEGREHAQTSRPEKTASEDTLGILEALPGQATDQQEVDFSAEKKDGAHDSQATDPAVAAKVPGGHASFMSPPGHRCPGGQREHGPPLAP